MYLLRRAMIFIIAGNQKAIVGFLAGGGMLLLALAGIDGEMTVNDALTALAGGAVQGLSVWLKRNRK